MANTFREFIARNSVQPAKPLPLVHTTAAYHLSAIRFSQQILPQVCDVFATPLTYFFVGRPAYKVRHSDGEAELWELPCCFIFEYEAVAKPTRVFPFDSGAFAKGKMPTYLSLMPKENFDVAEIDSAATKIIGAYFGDGAAYLAGRPKAGDGTVKANSNTTNSAAATKSAPLISHEISSTPEAIFNPKIASTCLP